MWVRVSAMFRLSVSFPAFTFRWNFSRADVPFDIGRIPVGRGVHHQPIVSQEIFEETKGGPDLQHYVSNESPGSPPADSFFSLWLAATILARASVVLTSRGTLSGRLLKRRLMVARNSATSRSRPWS